MAISSLSSLLLTVAVLSIMSSSSSGGNLLAFAQEPAAAAAAAAAMSVCIQHAGQNIFEPGHSNNKKKQSFPPLVVPACHSNNSNNIANEKTIVVRYYQVEYQVFARGQELLDNNNNRLVVSMAASSDHGRPENLQIIPVPAACTLPDRMVQSDGPIPACDPSHLSSKSQVCNATNVPLPSSTNDDDDETNRNGVFSFALVQQQESAKCSSLGDQQKELLLEVMSSTDLDLKCRSNITRVRCTDDEKEEATPTTTTTTTSSTTTAAPSSAQNGSVDANPNNAAAPPTSQPPTTSDTKPTTTKEDEESICTVTSLFYREQAFAPVDVPCPPVGEKVMLSFDFVMPQSNSTDDNNVGTVISVAAAHGPYSNWTEAIVMAGVYTNYRRNTNGTTSTTSFEDESVVCWRYRNPASEYERGETSNRFCNGDLSSPTQLCDSSPHGAAPGTRVKNLVVVWNTGGCQDQVRIHANLADSPFLSDDVTPSECVSEIAVDDHCDDENAIWDHDRICKQEYRTEDSSRHTFEPLEIPCPKEGEKVVASFQVGFRVPKNESDWDKVFGTQVTVSASHGPSFNETEGIALQYYMNVGENETSLYNPYFCGSIFDPALPGEDESVCYSANSPNELRCKNPLFFHPRGIGLVSAVVWNLGGCEESVRIGATVTDDWQNLFTSTTNCLTELKLDDQCDGEDVDMTVDGVCLSDSKSYISGSNRRLPPLDVPCPPLDERFVVSFELQLPWESAFGSSNDTQTSVSFAASYGEHLNETEGLVILDTCWDVHPNSVHDVFHGEVDNWLCDGSLYSPSKVCVSSLEDGPAGSKVNVTATVWNVAARNCTGTIRVEASIEDDKFSYQNDWKDPAMSQCLSELVAEESCRSPTFALPSESYQYDDYNDTSSGSYDGGNDTGDLFGNICGNVVSSLVDCMVQLCPPSSHSSCLDEQEGPDELADCNTIESAVCDATEQFGQCCSNCRQDFQEALACISGHGLLCRETISCLVDSGSENQAPTTQGPTQDPTSVPTQGPTSAPTSGPTGAPPTAGPTQGPTSAPTQQPTQGPTSEPTSSPSSSCLSPPTPLTALAATALATCFSHAL